MDVEVLNEVRRHAALSPARTCRLAVLVAASALATEAARAASKAMPPNSFLNLVLEQGRAEDQLDARVRDAFILDRVVQKAQKGGQLVRVEPVQKECHHLRGQKGSLAP